MDGNLLNQFWELLRCPICRSCPPTTPIYMCSGGHHICNNCHRAEIARASALFEADPDTRRGDAMCSMCGDVVTNIRSLFGEKFVKNYNAWYAMCQGRRNRQICHVEQKASSDVLWKSRSQSTMVEGELGRTRSEYDKGDFLKKYSQSNSSVTVTGESDPSASSSQESVSFANNLSRHTLVRCPKSPCARSFPCSMLTSHFYYNHRDVMSVPVVRHETFNVVFPPAAATAGVARIICLVYLEDTSSRSLSSAHRADLMRNRIPFLLMTSRVQHLVGCRRERGSLRRGGEEEEEEEEESVWDVTDYVLLWLCGVDGVTFKYTMEVTNIERPTKSFTFQGNVVPMERSLLAREILHSGDCALLLPGFIQSVASSTQGLDLNITIH